MPRPFIDDNIPLLEIATIAIREPNLKFSSMFRQMMQKLKLQCHSEASFRRRLQRKYNEQRERWIERGHEEIRARRDAHHKGARERLKLSLEEAARRVQPELDALDARMKSTSYVAHMSKLERTIRVAADRQERLKRIFKNPEFEKFVGRIKKDQEQFQKIFKTSGLEDSINRLQHDQKQMRRALEKLGSLKVRF